MAFKKLKLWFDNELAILLSEKIEIYRTDFNQARFVEDIERGVEDLELKGRVEFICDQLYEELGRDYSKDVTVLLNVLGPENENETGMFTEYYWVMPIAKYVEKYGLDDLNLSINALAEITKRNTSEYAVRPYLERYPDAMLNQCMKWSMDDNFHIRRLASEGIRPRLPWASKLDMFIDDPGKLLPILDALKDDKVKYVQKSVANCVNDILKDNYEVAQQLIENWNKKDISRERKWIIKHALRKLLKQDDPWAKSIVK